jgi:hypothetical protein
VVFEKKFEEKYLKEESNGEEPLQPLKWEGKRETPVDFRRGWMN